MPPPAWTASNKLAILADAAKYDARARRSGASGRRSDGVGGLGSTTGMGICHSYTPDGRCVSLLKILLTNFCLYDCRYCVNRRSSDVRRARFTVDEVVDLTLDFYRRNYIEGLFLTSGVIRSPDYTMEQLVRGRARAARRARLPRLHPPEDDPGRRPELLIEQAGRYADRLSRERRAADRARPARARAGEAIGRRSRSRWPTSAARREEANAETRARRASRPPGRARR